MANENELKEELIRQMKENSNKIPKVDKNSVQQILKKEEIRVRSTRKLTVFAWLLFIISLIAAGIIEAVSGPPPNLLPPTAAFVTLCLLIVAVIFTVSLYVRSRILTMHQIQSRLSNIEEQLKKMSQDK
jgi:quinol-cytochrome oxidoreductase complex cytochrome b subunit